MPPKREKANGTSDAQDTAAHNTGAPPIVESGTTAKEPDLPLSATEAKYDPDQVKPDRPAVLDTITDQWYGLALQFDYGFVKPTFSADVSAAPRSQHELNALMDELSQRIDRAHHEWAVRELPKMERYGKKI